MWKPGIYQILSFECSNPDPDLQDYLPFYR